MRWPPMVLQENIRERVNASNLKKKNVSSIFKSWTLNLSKKINVKVRTHTEKTLFAARRRTRIGQYVVIHHGRPAAKWHHSALLYGAHE